MTKKRNTAPVEIADELVDAGAPVRQRVIALNSLEGVRRYMARVIHEADAGKRRSDEASKMVYMLGQLKLVIEAISNTEHAERLLEIETRLGLAKVMGGNVRQLSAVPAAPASSEGQAS